MSYKTFLEALAGVTVTGVKRSYDFDKTPVTLNTADMPLQHVMLPGLGDESLIEAPSYAVQSRGMLTYHGTLVVVVGPVVQSTPAENLVLAVEIADAMATGLAAIQFTVGASLPEVTIRIWPNWAIGEVEHWAVTAEVTVVGSVG